MKKSEIINESFIEIENAKCTNVLHAVSPTLKAKASE